MKSWLEISSQHLSSNFNTFRSLVGGNVTLAPTVKANAYGHGLIECAKIFENQGADYLCVDAVEEAQALRKAGIQVPILIIGYTPLSDLKAVIDLECDQVIYNRETIVELAKLKKNCRIHLKIETGTHRQGIDINELPSIVELIKKHKTIECKGISTHFSNLEDRINHEYALRQLKEFNKAIHIMEAEGIAPHFRHCASTAATMLMPEAHFNFVRTGIGNYGLWPSQKTKKAIKRAGINNIVLKPALSWKTVIAQVKQVKKGALISYGCTHEMKKNGTIAVLPVGYYDGYVRAHSGKGHVLIRGKKAPVIGRICMNMFMVDVSDIPNVKLEDEVVLMGKQKGKIITAEDLAKWSGTINYEVTTRLSQNIERIVT